MKLAILSDAHGNSLALSKCLKYITEIYKADQIYFLGDAVGYFPDYVGVLELLKSNNVICLSGNHEAMLLGNMELDEKKDEVYQIKKNKCKLNESHIAFLKSLLPFHQLKLNSNILLAHGSPFDPLNGYVYPTTSLENFDFLPYEIIFLGHTHHPFVKQVNSKWIVNVGSCGLPRDNGSLLSFAIYDSEKEEIEVLRIYLDPKEVIDFYSESNLHESVTSCLFRKNKNETIGRIIN